MTLPVHPALAAFPMLFEDELGALASDIQKNGLQSPIVRHDGQIVDGRARLVVCERLGVKPRFVDHDGDPVDYVLRTNGGRRLTTGQRALVAAEIFRAKADGVSRDTDGSAVRDSAACRATLSKVSRATPEERVTAHSVGESLGVSRESVFRALKLLDAGAGEDVEAVRRGSLPIFVAWRRLSAETTSKKAPKPKSDRAAIVAGVDRAEKKAHALLEELRELAADGLGRKLLEDLLLDLSKQLFELTEAPPRDAEPEPS